MLDVLCTPLRRTSRQRRCAATRRSRGRRSAPPLPGAVTAGHPPGFENAARAEHQNEALALRHMLTQQQVRGWANRPDHEIPCILLQGFPCAYHQACWALMLCATMLSSTVGVCNLPAWRGSNDIAIASTDRALPS